MITKEEMDKINQDIRETAAYLSEGAVPSEPRRAADRATLLAIQIRDVLPSAEAECECPRCFCIRAAHAALARLQRGEPWQAERAYENLAGGIERRKG